MELDGAGWSWMWLVEPYGKILRAGPLPDDVCL